ncbi:MAG: class I SAM-dependent methyltransferase [Pirellulaceae bacterium]
MSSTHYAITPEIAQYIRSVSLHEPAVLRQLREETEQLDDAVMQVSPELGQFIRLLIRLIGAKNILELGVFTGYSSLSMALAIPDDGSIIACDVSDEWTRIARRYWQQAGVDHKIDLRLAPALETLETLQLADQDSFDLIFLDADKVNYGAYYEMCIELLRSNGLLLIDNTLWEFKVAIPEIVDPETNAIQGLNRRIHQDERVEASMLLFGDGLTVVRKR